MWSSDGDYIWRWPTYLMVPCMDDDDHGHDGHAYDLVGAPDDR